jgi:hypothetical protein
MILAIDPGKTHFAYAIISKKKGIVKTGMIRNVIDDFSKDNLTLQVVRFVRELKRLFIKYPITIIVSERYQVRGRFGGMMGASCEYISYMAGIIGCLFRKRSRIYCITPALWKNYMYKTYDYPTKSSLTEVFGFYGLSKNFSTVPILEHQFDAVGIGVWAANKFWSLDLYKKCKKRLIKLWKKGKPTSKIALKSYNKVKLK